MSDKKTLLGWLICLTDTCGSIATLDLFRAPGGEIATRRKPL